MGVITENELPLVLCRIAGEGAGEKVGGTGGGVMYVGDDVR